MQLFIITLHLLHNLFLLLIFNEIFLSFKFLCLLEPSAQSSFVRFLIFPPANLGKGGKAKVK